MTDEIVNIENKKGKAFTFIILIYLVKFFHYLGKNAVYFFQISNK